MAVVSGEMPGNAAIDIKLICAKLVENLEPIIFPCTCAYFRNHLGIHKQNYWRKTKLFLVYVIVMYNIV